MVERKLTTLTSTAVPLDVENIDTDQIIPARFLKSTTREGFGENLFCDWRRHADGSINESFILNNPKYSGKIILAGQNFGCGSSREHAAWAIADYGFKVVISSFFADIFKNNALNNFILPIQIKDELIKILLKEVTNKPSISFKIDLEKQQIEVSELNIEETFDINPYKKTCLLNGYDDIDFLLSMKKEIESYERNCLSHSLVEK